MNKNISEHIRNANRKVTGICRTLINTPVVPADSLTKDKDSVPCGKGIYLWTSKNNKAMLYIGIALGKRGLRQRIINQHLRPTYTKSVFRKKVSEQKELVDNDTVAFILTHYSIAWYECPAPLVSFLEAAEALLIAALRPRFNTKGRA